MWLCLSVLLSLDWSNFRLGLTELSSDGANLSVGASRENDSLGSALGDRGRTVGDVKAITRASLLIKGSVLLLANRKGLSGK